MKINEESLRLRFYTDMTGPRKHRRVPERTWSVMILAR